MFCVHVLRAPPDPAHGQETGGPAGESVVKRFGPACKLFTGERKARGAVPGPRLGRPKDRRAAPNLPDPWQERELSIGDGLTLIQYESESLRDTTEQCATYIGTRPCRI